jgi:predicted DCC family thiol-disulfide oxidoreductase YuxK
VRCSCSPMFAATQSSTGAPLMRETGLDPRNPSMFVLVEHGNPYVRSGAVIGISRHLRFPWRRLVAARVIPRYVRDVLYGSIARNPYRWFGRAEACMLPSQALADRFPPISLKQRSCDPLRNFVATQSASMAFSECGIGQERTLIDLDSKA